MKEYKDFYERINSEKAAKILITINKFISEIMNRTITGVTSILEISQKTQVFITETTNQFCGLFNREAKYTKLYPESCDGIEAIITKGIYNKVFSATQQEKDDDYNFDLLLRSYQFITLSHLEIDKSIIDDTYINFAIMKLNEINQYKTPKKKIKILIDFCNIVSSMVCDNGSKGKLAGAEEVFPIIVYVIIKAKANKLKANLNFIRHFRHTSRLESEDDYYFTTISQAIQFLDDLTHQQLNISESEFISSIEESQKKDIIRKYNSCFANYHKNPDENILLHSLKNKSEALELKEINYKNENLKQQAKNSQSDNSILLNDSTKKLLQVDTESINKKFFMNSFQDLTIGDQQKMFTQFYDILKLVDNFKKENAEIVIGSISTTTTNNNGIGR